MGRVVVGLVTSLVVLQVAAVEIAVVNEHVDDPVSAVTALLSRVLPHHASFFKLNLVSQVNGTEVMGLSNDGKHIVLSGSGGVELSSALNWYLNDFLNVTYDWNTYGAGQLPSQGQVLPLPPGTSLQRTRQFSWSYYMNVCTMGYSLAFVPWSYWEKHIDWMALSGINLPLAFVGQEWLWLEVFKSYNFTLDDITDFFSGPAFLPWFRMGNMQGWGGPITESWLEQRRDLQLKILARMRGLGMTPVLGAFAGHLPQAFAKRFPAAKISKSPDWARFSGQYGNVDLLEPTDPFYKEIGGKFIETQAKIFGTDHIYNCDTYNEMVPPTSDTGYLQKASKAVYDAMAVSDSQAVWLMQGWLFYSARSFWKPAQVQAYLGGVPDTSMWILDLYGASHPVWDTTESFYGKPFIFCTLLNFGGQQGLTGNLPQLATNLAKATGKGVIGVGITMEGIWTNYPVFEATLHLAWEPAGTFDHSVYLDAYSRRVYGGSAKGVETAWHALRPAYEGKEGGFGSRISSYPGSSLQEQQPNLETAHLTPACVYSGEQKGVYLAMCADGSRGPCPKYKSLDAAQVVCSATTSCTGVTLSHGAWELRGGAYPQSSPSGESSWVITNPIDCHPGYVPPGALWKVALHDLLSEASNLGSIAAFRFDLVDVGRQALSERFDARLTEFKSAFKVGNRTNVRQLGRQLLTMIDDYDKLLSTDEHFMLGRWLAWARAWGQNDAERDALEFNARNQITLWGPKGEINDYAKKEWGGLVRGYYRHRWSICIEQASSSAPNWNADAYFNSVFNQVELPFSESPFADHYPTVPEGDALVVAREIYDKYFQDLKVLV